MPRIMVETNEMLTHMWRTGCVLENNGSNALITNYKNRISIVVEGDYKRKREFMSVIRYLIDSINQNLSHKPAMLIPLPRINALVDYEELLEREKDGEKNYTIYKPAREKFEISKLLEGIATPNELREINTKLDTVLSNHEIIQNQLDIHFQYLLEFHVNHKIKNEIIEAIASINEQQTQEITQELGHIIATFFDDFDSDMNVKLQELYSDLKKSDNIQVKLKLSFPLINLLGIKLESEFDVKSWAAKMYQKHELKIFKLMGVL